MKTILKSILLGTIFCFAMFSCNSDELTTGGTLTGTIADYVTGSIDSLKCCANDSIDSIIGKTAVLSNGKFTLILTAPTGSKVKKMTGVVISDSTAQWGTGKIYAFKSHLPIGSVTKCNFTHNSSATPTVGDGYVMLVYSTKPFSLKGSLVKDTVTTTYDMNLKSGWNQVLYKLTEYTISATGRKLTYTNTTSIPTDLKWRYFSFQSQKIKRFQYPGIR